MDSQRTAGQPAAAYIAGWTVNELWPRAAIELDVPANIAAGLYWVFHRSIDLPVKSWWPVKCWVPGWRVVPLNAYPLDPRRLTMGEHHRLKQLLILRYRLPELEAERVIAYGVPVLADWLRVVVPVWRIQ